MRTRTAALQGGDGRWPQHVQPPPYQQSDHFLESGRDPVRPHTHPENEPLLGRYRTVQERPVKNCRPQRVFWFFAVFFIAVFFIAVFFIGYRFDRFFNYDLYEKLGHWTQEEAQRKAIRASWIEEVKQHEVDAAKWKEEKAAIDAERKKWEEEQAGKRTQLIWVDLNPGRCLRYGTREYKAVLSSLGSGMDALGECSNKTLSFHGREILPTFCDLEGPCGRVTGHWAIDFDVEGCSPWWDTLTDKGCDRDMHKHRYEAHLMNVQNKNDWEVLCQTTPMTIDGMHHDGAMSCLDSFWGVFGVWFVEDKDCS